MLVNTSALRGDAIFRTRLFDISFAERECSEFNEPREALGDHRDEGRREESSLPTFGSEPTVGQDKRFQIRFRFVIESRLLSREAIFLANKTGRGKHKRMQIPSSAASIWRRSVRLFATRDSASAIRDIVIRFLY